VPAESPLPTVVPVPPGVPPCLDEEPSPPGTVKNSSSAAATSSSAAAGEGDGMSGATDQAPSSSDSGMKASGPITINSGAGNQPLSGSASLQSARPAVAEVLSTLRMKMPQGDSKDASAPMHSFSNASFSPLGSASRHANRPSMMSMAFQAVHSGGHHDVVASSSGNVPNVGRSRVANCRANIGFWLRRRAAPHCRAVNKNRFFQIFMFLALLGALFLPDLWVVADRPNNSELDIILIFILVCFLFELAVQSIGLSKSYWFSFFFWMDLVGAASLLLDLSFLPFMDMLAVKTSGDGGNTVTGNVMVTRLARVAKLGARAGRFTKLVKLLRFLPGMREQGTDQGTAKVISNRLITALATRVSCLIILMVIVMPLFSMWTYPEQDWSMKSWLFVVDLTIRRHPERLQAQIGEFEEFYGEKAYWPYRLANKATNDVLHEFSRGSPVRSTNMNRYEAGNVTCDFNFTEPNRVDSAMNMVLMLVIMILMVGFSLVLSNSVSAIVLKPLERLLTQVRKMASTIFQSVTDMGAAMKDAEEDNISDSSLDEDTHAVGNAFGNETQLLEKVVQKLAALSEITMNKSCVDAETMEGLGEADRAVITGYQGNWGGNNAWAGPATEGENEDDDPTHDILVNAQRMMVENAGLSLELIDSWDLNPLDLDKARNMAAAKYFVGPQNHGVTFDPVAMSLFLESVEAGYNKTCSYHNWFHAIDVTHGVYRLLYNWCTEAYLSGYERYALLVSAVCHDVGHPGTNNPFMVETSHELALRYNDKSPLENMHCARLFEFVSVPSRNIFAAMAKPQFQEVRKVCIEAILHTDNQHHFAMVKEVQMMYEVNSEILDASRELYLEEGVDEFPSKEAVDCFRQVESRKLLRKLPVHVADISNSMKPFRICRIWAWQVLEEFFSQGDMEKSMGIPVQALNDREKVNRPLSQVGFIEFLVSPLIFVVCKVLPPTEPQAEQMIENAKTWHKQWLSDTRPTPPETEQKSLEERLKKLAAKFFDR